MPERTCAYCPAPITSRHPAARRCSRPECLRAFNAERGRRYLREYAERTGARYEYRYAEQRSAARGRRRARKAGAGAEVFKHREVFDRDAWTCGICAEPVDPALKYPDPRSASLDHVIPLSRGGQHTRANTRCAHLRCNIRRGNRLDLEDAQVAPLDPRWVPTDPRRVRHAQAPEDARRTRRRRHRAMEVDRRALRPAS